MNNPNGTSSKANAHRRKPKCILPGSCIGILGGGQLGRMLAIEAKKLGYRVGILDPQENAPAAQVSDFFIQAEYSDAGAVGRFANACDVITFEFENVNAAELDAAIGGQSRIFPAPGVLHIAQNREREKLFLQREGFPCAAFEVVKSAADLKAACEGLGFPCVLKTADFGYDGKGQVRLDGSGDFEEIWRNFGAPRGVLEAWVTYSAELSVVCARWKDGTSLCFPASENIHKNHILHESIVPARFQEEILGRVAKLAERIAKALDVVGLIAVEMFLLPNGEILVNELAPRPHNSGHYSFDACITSQFEQQIRAICNLPPGSTALLSPVVMVNLLGDLWQNGAAPDWRTLLADPTLKLHLYGKAEAKPGRKMGHFCVLDKDVKSAIQRAEEAFCSLANE